MLINLIKKLNKKLNTKVFDPTTPKYKNNYNHLKKFIVQFIIGFLFCEFVPLLLFPFAIIFVTFIPEIDLIIKFIIVLTSFLISSYFFYLIFIKFQQIRINNYTLYSSKIKKDINLVVISDLHIGQKRYNTNLNRLRKIIKLVNSIDVEIIFFLGDFIDEALYEDILKELKNLKHKYKIGVYGNHDAHYLYHNNIYSIPLDVVNCIEKQDIKVLINEDLVIDDMYIYGIPDLWSNKLDFNKVNKNMLDQKFSILLSHNPDIVDDVISQKLNFDLILSGHNHGGQVSLPFFKFPVPSKYQWLRKGIYSINSHTKLLLTEGIGHSGTRVRIGTYSEICLIKIRVK